MKGWTLTDYLFVLCLVAFEGVGVKYFGSVFTTATRWAFLVLLGGLLLIRNQLFLPFSTRFGPILGLYMLWCVATTAWSIVTPLSGPKSMAMVLSATVMLAGGYAWAITGRRQILTYLAPILAIALFAGYFDRGATVHMDNVEIYQGLTGNPNYLGILIAMSMPLAFWFAHRSWRDPIRRAVSGAIIAALLAALWLAGSRAAFLCVIAVGVGFFAATVNSRKLVIGGLVGALAASVFVTVPTVQHAINVRVINKANSAEGVFYSRKYVWAESYDLAKQGGLMGVGYGATAGKTDLSRLRSSLSSYGYGREKGNSQLAVWEETGLIGLGFYGLLIIAVFAELGSAWQKRVDPELKGQLGVLTGAVAGILIQSIFEAWWVSPGSPEFAYFFATLGVAAGVARRINVTAFQANALQRSVAGRRREAAAAVARP